MTWTAKKVHNRKLATNSVPAEQLETIYAVRTLGEERQMGQYKLIENGKTRYFANFLELRFHSTFILRNQHKHVIIVRGEIPDDSC